VYCFTCSCAALRDVPIRAGFREITTRVLVILPQLHNSAYVFCFAAAAQECCSGYLAVCMGVTWGLAGVTVGPGAIGVDKHFLLGITLPT
jgi:hypothetical protein